MIYYDNQTKQSNIFSIFSVIQFRSFNQSMTSTVIQSIGWLCYRKCRLTKLCKRAECKQLSANNFVGFCLQTTSTVVEVLRCRSMFRSLPSSSIRRTLTQMRCRTVAIHRRWYRSLWVSTTLAVESPTDLFVASHWLGRSSCRFPASLLVFIRADHSTSQVPTTSHVVFISTFYWKLASKSLHAIIPPLIDSAAVTSHVAFNSDACNIQISSQNSRIRC